MQIEEKMKHGLGYGVVWQSCSWRLGGTFIANGCLGPSSLKDLGYLSRIL